MTDEEAIRRTIAQYCHFTDDGLFDDSAALLAPDAGFVVMGTTHEGPAGVKAFLEEFQGPANRGKHVTANSVIDVDGDRARAWTDYVFVGPDMTVWSAGRYHDTLVRGDDGRWRFTERRIAFMGDAAGQPEPG